MKRKLTRYNFAFEEDIALLIQKIAHKTDLSYTAIAKQAVKLLAKEKGIQE